MGIPVLIIGKSGTGKSTSLRNMPADTGIINVIGKPLPFKTKIKPVQYTDYNTIKYVLDKAKGTRFVIDDAGYLITDEFMRGHGKNQSGSSVFDLYNNMADHFYDLIRFVSTNLAEDKIVYIMMHEDQSETFGTVKPKTIGQYTGLTDKNSKKIFEGDILKVVDQNREIFIYKVVFTNGVFGTVIKNGGYACALVLLSKECIEVIGNIHDNPELLEKERENNER